MSKLITTRYEYATYDDAAGSLTSVPATYPPTLDQYSGGTVGNAAAGYGVANVNSPDLAQTLALPSNAGGIVVCPVSNTTMVSVFFTATLVPGGAATNLAILCGPGQTVSLPAAWSASSLSVGSCNKYGVGTGAIPFAAQVLWSF